MRHSGRVLGSTCTPCSLRLLNSLVSRPLLEFFRKGSGDETSCWPHLHTLNNSPYSIHSFIQSQLKGCWWQDLHSHGDAGSTRMQEGTRIQLQPNAQLTSCLPSSEFRSKCLSSSPNSPVHSQLLCSSEITLKDADPHDSIWKPHPRNIISDL